MESLWIPLQVLSKVYHIHDDAMASDQCLPSESIDSSEANLEGQLYC